MQGRHEHDMVILLQLVLILTLQLPVCLVDKDQDARSSSVGVRKTSSRGARSNLHGIVEDEHIFSWVLHDFVAQVPYKESYV
jgi:hypothetical protein